MKLHTIETGFFKLDGGAMFGVVPKQIWQKLCPPDALNLCTWAMRCLLVETSNRLILIDTGIGSKQPDKFLAHYHLHGSHTLHSSLANKGFNRHDLTDVILTHLHFDHCGGAIDRTADGTLVPAFKNARYWTNTPHWDWATQPNDREKASFLPDNILPLLSSGQLNFVPTNGTQTVAFDGELNLSLRMAFGHTQAMMLPQITVGETTIVFMADLIPSVAHLPLPYVMGYDMFPCTTLQEKKSFLEEALAGNYVLFFEHDAHTACCTLAQTEKGIRAGNTGSLTDFIAA
ncbi:MAG: MBL fold metallo-hydrolase [Bacteroidetes bacterium]|nr:MAG: MBL fold metallo-hydrolase [Bacteroidota bacterium]